MARLASSLFVVLMLLVGPALCSVGLLEHECDCGEGGVESQCQHEESCSDDPCATVATTPERDLLADPEPDVARIPVAVLAWDLEPTAGRRSRASSPPPLPDRCRLPYAASDRPQLL